mgnify:CR=1 FL=1
MHRGSTAGVLPYSGTECAAGLTLGLLENPLLLPPPLLSIIDIPLSLIADTLVLPVDLWSGVNDRRDCVFFHI